MREEKNHNNLRENKANNPIRIRNPNPKRSESSDDDPDPTDVVLVPGKRSHPTVDVFVTALNIT